MVTNILTTSQAKESVVYKPIPQYSRVVGVRLETIENGQETYQFTPPLGNRIWLLTVKVWFFFFGGSGVYALDYDIYTGTEEPTTEEQCKQMEKVIPMYPHLDQSGFWSKAAYDEKTWEMKKQYDDDARRFGLWVNNGCDWWLQAYATFEVSEG